MSIHDPYIRCFKRKRKTILQIAGFIAVFVVFANLKVNTTSHSAWPFSSHLRIYFIRIDCLQSRRSGRKGVHSRQKRKTGAENKVPVGGKPL